jgi:hypothetical protein
VLREAPVPGRCSLYIDLKAGPSARPALAPRVKADFAADGTIVGLDIESAGRLDLSSSRPSTFR